jgi:2-polyprenyl-6-methoxyphenol hydroxylase-like FAD-dependent oxidoreductase
MTQQNASPTKALSVAVFGGSVSGLMSALMLAKRGFDVVLYEKRASYTRNVQWGIRQCFIDYLAGIDQEAAADFSKRASSITSGHRFLADKSYLYENGAYHHQQRTPPRAGTCATRDLSAVNTLNEEIVCLIPAKALEQLLYEHLKRHRVTIRHTETPDITFDANDELYRPIESSDPTRYDLIVVCEGAASTTRAKAGIVSMNVSRPITQVSGEVYLKRGGMITEYLHAIETGARIRGELLLSLLVSTERHQSSWIVGDVSSQCLSALKKIRKKGARERLIEEEFRKIAARTMVDTVENIHDAGYRGAVRGVELFDLQARISNKAAAGRNLVLAGDAVGVGHWAVGGGMHVAAACHIQKLEALASSIQQGGSPIDKALQSYSSGVLSDTRAWISKSIKYYYLSIPIDVMTAVFDNLLGELMMNNSIDLPKRLKARVTDVYFG